MGMYFSDRCTEKVWLVPGTNSTSNSNSFHISRSVSLSFLVGRMGRACLDHSLSCAPAMSRGKTSTRWTVDATLVHTCFSTAR